MESENRNADLQVQRENDDLRAAKEALERKTAELARSEERYRMLGSITPHLLWSTSPQGAADDFNYRWLEYTGQTLEEASGDGWLKIVHPDDVANVMRVWQHSVAMGEPYEVEYRLRRRDGEYLWFEGRATPLLARDGSIMRWYGSSTDIHQRKITDEALREESAITEQLFEVAKTLSVELDLGKVVQIITDAGTRVTRAHVGAFFYNVAGPEAGAYVLYAVSGAPREAFKDFPMQRVTEMFGPTVRGEAGIRLGDVRKDPRFAHKAPFHGLRAGHLLVLSCLAVPVVARDGSVLGGLFFGHAQTDAFTERDERMVRGIAAQAAAAMETARLYLAEQQARTAAESASQAKDRFLAVLSHELRTPLTPVLMTATAWETSTELPELLRSDMTMIRRNVEMEARLIDDLLDLSRITTGKLALNVEPVSVNDTVGHVIMTCHPRAHERGVALASDLDGDPCVISADPARLQQVLWNLVNNAVKFTPESGRVEISTRRHDGDRVRIQVKDTGMGIEPGVLPQVFDAFEQGPAGVTRQFGGLGLGLAICKALVERHQGVITVESAGRGAGATFTVLLPVGMPADWPRPEKPAAPHLDGAKKLRLLVVEDDADTARTLEILLGRAGYDVVTADTVAAALQRLEEQIFDLLVSDLGLPDGTGYDLMKKIQGRHALRGIAMSGYGMEEDVRKSWDAGFSEHLVKPVSVAKLIEAIGRTAVKG